MEEEISLREIIEVLVKGKRLIAAVTAAAILLSVFVSFFILKPTYEAQSTINIRLPSAAAQGDFLEMVEAMSRLTAFDLETYRVQISNHSLMEQVIQELDLPYTAENLSRSIQVDRIGNTNMLRISYTDHSPETAAAVINTLTEKFLQFITEKKVEEIAVSTGFIQEQKNLAEASLSEALNRLKVFLQEPNHVSGLDAEIKAKLQLVTKYKSDLIVAGVEVSASKKERDSLKKQLAATPSSLTTRKSVATDPYLQSLLTGLTGENVVDISSLEFISREINPVHVYLSQELAVINTLIDRQQEEIARMGDAVTALEENLESLQILFAERKITHDDLQRQVDIHSNNLLALSDRYTAARMTESIEAGKMTISVVSPAIPPSNPSGPNKKLNVAIAAVLGMMAGVFTVFFLHYWKESGKEQGLQQNNAL